MALSKDLLRVCEVNRIMLDHLDFHCDLEVDEELIEPAMPRRIIKDLWLQAIGVQSYLWLVQRIHQGLARATNSTTHWEEWNGLPIHRLAIFLQYLRTNGFHKSVGTQFFIKVDQSVVTRTVNSVSRIVASLWSKYVTFPTIEEGNQITKAIYEDTGIPGVIGIIGGLH